MLDTIYPHVLLENKQCCIFHTLLMKISMTSFIAFCIESIIIKRKLQYEFYLLVVKTIFYSFIKYCFHHSKIKSVSLRHRVIFSLSLSLYIHVYVYLTNRFHFAVVCSVIDAQMMSQRSKNKDGTHELPGQVGH